MSCLDNVLHQHRYRGKIGVYTSESIKVRSTAHDATTGLRPVRDLEGHTDSNIRE